MTAAKVFWPIIFLAMSALPLLQSSFRLFPDVKAHGAEMRALLPSFTLKAFWDGAFQTQCEKWLSKTIGFRGVFVRTDNQINLSLFREFSSSSRFQLVLGKDNYLYGWSYVKYYMEPKAFSDERMNAIVRRLKRVQNALRARDKGFLLLISPSKATLYEEGLPEEYRRRKSPLPSNYDRMMPLLRQAKINVLDSVSMLRDLKAQGVTAFSRGSTHWTFSSACLVAAEIKRQLEGQTGERYPAIPCSPTHHRATPVAQDMDLATLSNLWSTNQFSEPLTYPNPIASTKNASKIPTMSIVGSSFMWAILHYLDAYKMYSDRAFFYYFNTKHTYPPTRPTPVRRDTFNFDTEILDRDLVLIEVNESVITSVGFGVLPALVKHLNLTQRADGNKD